MKLISTIIFLIVLLNNAYADPWLKPGRVEKDPLWTAASSNYYDKTANNTAAANTTNDFTASDSDVLVNTPTENPEAANKAYVDAADTNLQAQIDGTGTNLYYKSDTNYNLTGNVGITASLDVGTGNTNAGINATTIGTNVTASGARSFAQGFRTIASGENATALGDRTVASGTGAFAAGCFSEATTNYTIALGFGADATAVWAAALNEGTLASGSRSLAVNEDTIASGSSSFAWGNGNEAEGAYSTCGGEISLANGYLSFVYGSGAWDSDFDYCWVISDSSGMAATTNDQFAAHFEGGYLFYGSGPAKFEGEILAGSIADQGAYDLQSKDGIFTDSLTLPDGSVITGTVTSISVTNINFDQNFTAVGSTTGTLDSAVVTNAVIEFGVITNNADSTTEIVNWQTLQAEIQLAKDIYETYAEIGHRSATQLDVDVTTNTSFVTTGLVVHADSGDLTASATNILTGSTGDYRIVVDGSLGKTGAGTIFLEAHVFTNGVDTEIGVSRSISTQAAQGSFAGSGTLTNLSSGVSITLHTWILSGTETLEIDHLTLDVQRRK